MVIRCIKLCFVTGLLSCWFAGAAYSQSAPAQPTSGDLVAKLDGFINVDAAKMGFIGLLVKSLKDDRVMYSHDSTKIFIPASCMKLIATSAALDALGPDYKLKTEVLATGDQQGDTLKGDLILKGYGDSSLDTKGLSEIADAVKAAGIKQVTGDLIADDSYFDSQRFGYGWSWDYEPDTYAAPVGALVLNHNCTDIVVKPGKPGEDVLVSFGPACGYFQVANSVKTSPAGTRAGLRVNRRHGTNQITVSGRFPADAKPDTTTLTVDDPTLWTGSVFQQMLNDRGITIAGKLNRGTAPSSARVINTHYSQPLSSVLENINRHSINVMAECLQKTLGAQLKGHGTIGSGIDAEVDFLKKIGVPLDQVNIQDGSGLSRADMVSPAALVTILCYMYKSPNSKVWQDSLPVAGGDGTLYFSMRKTPAEGNLRAKTGNLGWVQSIAGYVDTKSGEPLVFALIANNYKCSDDVIYHMRTQIGVTLASLP